MIWLLLLNAELPAKLDTVRVSADPLGQSTLELPVSVTHLDQRAISAPGVTHLQDLIERVPNLNWQAGSSRPRYFQIRGIGEDSQYQGAPNPSVGFLVDDIDYSALGGLALAYDIDRIEVLRGPQGTRYGAHALAGLINVRSNDPTRETVRQSTIGVGNDGALRRGALVSGEIGNALSGRLVAFRQDQDGFRDNAYTGRNDTNGRAESLMRAKLHYEQGQNDWRLTLLHADLNNGYDAFAIDNGRTTYSDRPGRDAQRSTGLSLRGEIGLGELTLTSISALGSTRLVSSFDGDWGNPEFWAAFGPYDYYSQTLRERRNLSQDLRLSGQAGQGRWLLGLYASRLDEDNQTRDDYNGELLAALDARYQASSHALYSQLERPLTGPWTLVGGVRVEHRRADYVDSDGLTLRPKDQLWGTQLALTRTLGSTAHGYVSVARGYKAGGFNIGRAIPETRREFGPEALWSVEAGVKAATADGRSQGTVGWFYSWRRDQQVQTSFQADPTDPLTFVYYTDNAARGRNLGLEAEGRHAFDPRLAIDASLGLLHTRIEDCLCGERRVDGRAQANAPRWQYAMGIDYAVGESLAARLEVSGRAGYYFSDSHDQRSGALTLVHASLSRRFPSATVAIYARNLLDRDYPVRGFYFGNEPPDFTPTLYTQTADGRSMGLRLDLAL